MIDLEGWYRASYRVLTVPARSLAQSEMMDGSTPGAVLDGGAVPRLNVGRGRYVLDRERAAEAVGGDPDDPRDWAAQLVRFTLSLERSRQPGHRSGAHPLAILRARAATALVCDGNTQRKAARIILGWEDRLPDDPEPGIRAQSTRDREAALLGSIRDTCATLGVPWPPPKV